MAKRMARIKAEGRLTIPLLVELASAFSDLLAAITKAKGGDDVPVEWVLENARYGSIDIQSVALAGNQSAIPVIDDAYDEWTEIVRLAMDGVVGGFDPEIIESLERISTVSRFTRSRVLLGNSDDDDELLPVSTSIGEALASADEDVPPIFLRPKARTSVRGRIVTCDDKMGTYFTLQSLADGRNIRCYPHEGDQERIGEYWGSRTIVLVEGTFSRYKASPTMTDISAIVSLGSPDGDEWMEARGSAPGIATPALSTNEAIRRFRNGQV